jgi:nitroimidazol reductase NimA-like FMN-containing flavoprotein (pyridoxamine 5'-phosphate oxidase superfamily)
MSSQYPKTSRPHMPDYGILGADEGEGLLPWEWATERLSVSHNYLVVTTRPDGRPHVMPVWGLWLDDAFYFSTGRQSRKAQNLGANPYCVVSTDRLDEAVIVEGMAEEVAGRDSLKPFYEAYKEKYDWDLEKMGFDKEPVYIVRPRVVFGIRERDFTSSATRWTFDDKVVGG